jgi:signal peptidase I
VEYGNVAVDYNSVYLDKFRGNLFRKETRYVTMTVKDYEELERINQELLDERIAKKYAAKFTGIAEPEKARETEKIYKKKTRKSQTAQITPVWKDLLLLLFKTALIVLIFILLFTFLYGIIRYAEPSMAPMIKDGDLVLFYRYTESGYLPQDAVVLDFQGQRQVRRVVATEGDTVDITEQGLVVNGAPQQEPDIYQKTERYQDGIDFPLTVPEGHIFVLGDSRANSTDSRVYGCVNIEDTLGKVMAVIRRRSI